MTFKEIKKQAEQKEVKRYLRSNELNQAKGLTDFIKDLEKQAKEKNIYFDIIGGNVKTIIPYERKNIYNNETITHETKKEILFNNYVCFIYDNFYYYIELNENPFFDHHYNKINLLKDEKGFYYIDHYYLNIFDPLAKIENLWTYGEEARKEIKKELKKEFEKMKISDQYKKIKTPYYTDKTYLNTKKIYFDI